MAPEFAPPSSTRWVSEKMNREMGVDGSREAAWCERAPLVDSAVGVDVRVGVLVLHAVCGGARPVYYRGDTVARSGSCCSTLCSMTRLEAF